MHFFLFTSALTLAFAALLCAARRRARMGAHPEQPVTEGALRQMGRRRARRIHDNALGRLAGKDGASAFFHAAAARTGQRG